MGFDYAVVGAGINGTFAALHLARRGHNTVLIEQVSTVILYSIHYQKIQCNIGKYTITHTITHTLRTRIYCT